MTCLFVMWYRLYRIRNPKATNLSSGYPFSMCVSGNYCGLNVKWYVLNNDFCILMTLRSRRRRSLKSCKLCMMMMMVILRHSLIATMCCELYVISDWLVITNHWYAILKLSYTKLIDTDHRRLCLCLFMQIF